MKPNFYTGEVVSWEKVQDESSEEGGGGGLQPPPPHRAALGLASFVSGLWSSGLTLETPVPFNVESNVQQKRWPGPESW